MDDVDETLVAVVEPEPAELHWPLLLTLLLVLGEAVPVLILGEGTACEKPPADIVAVTARYVQGSKNQRKMKEQQRTQRTTRLYCATERKVKPTVSTRIEGALRLISCVVHSRP